MPYLLSSLTPQQVLMLIRLDAGPEEDSVGLEISSLSECEIRAIDGLHNKGLVKLHPGWRNTFWFRLTKTGWEIRINGQTG